MKVCKFICFFVLLFVLLTGCNGSKLNTPSNQEVQVKVYADTDAEGEKIYPGEMISLTIVIENLSNEMVEITNFASLGAQFAYSSSEAFRLITPSGKNLMEPFFKEQLSEKWETLKVNPNSKGYYSIYPNQFLLFDEPGLYSFSVTLTDQNNISYESTSVQFTILPILTQCPTNEVDLTFNFNHSTIKTSELSNLEVNATIKNNSNKPWVFYNLGATGHRFSPIYMFLWRSTNNDILMPVSFNEGQKYHIFPIYDHLAIRLEPQQSHHLTIRGPDLTNYPLLRTPNKYTLQLIYISLPRDPGTKTELTWLAPETCLGVVQSEPVQLEILPEA